MFKRMPPPRLSPVWVQVQYIAPNITPRATALVGATEWYLVFGNEVVGTPPAAPAELLQHPTYVQLNV